LAWGGTRGQDAEGDKGLDIETHLRIESYPTAEGLVDSRERRTSAEFEGDGDILGVYCRQEEEDCTGAAANAATLSMSPTKWNELLEIRKQKWGEEGVVGATDEVMGGAEGVYS